MSSSVIAGLAFETLLYEKKAGIAYITLNRPKVLNALNKKAIADLKSQEWRQATEVARQECVIALEDLNTHRRQHGC